MSCMYVQTCWYVCVILLRVNISYILSLFINLFYIIEAWYRVKNLSQNSETLNCSKCSTFKLKTFKILNYAYLRTSYSMYVCMTHECMYVYVIVCMSCVLCVFVYIKISSSQLLLILCGGSTTAQHFNSTCYRTGRTNNIVVSYIDGHPTHGIHATIPRTPILTDISHS